MRPVGDDRGCGGELPMLIAIGVLVAVVTLGTLVHGAVTDAPFPSAGRRNAGEGMAAAPCGSSLVLSDGSTATLVRRGRSMPVPTGREEE